jgi:hypothetical protein
MRGKSNVIKRNVEKVWGARYTLGARCLPKNTVLQISGESVKERVSLPPDVVY